MDLLQVLLILISASQQWGGGGGYRRTRPISTLPLSSWTSREVIDIMAKAGHGSPLPKRRVLRLICHQTKPPCRSQTLLLRSIPPLQHVSGKRLHPLTTISVPPSIVPSTIPPSTDLLLWRRLYFPRHKAMSSTTIL